MTFESIVHSRLTGRYYQPVVAQIFLTGPVNFTTNPLPTSGWSGSGTNIESGSYDIVFTNSALSTSYPLSNGFDGNDNTYFGWYLQSESPKGLTIEAPTLFKVKKIKLKIDGDSNTRHTLTISGSADGSDFTDLYSGTCALDVLTEYELTSPGLYRFYKFTFLNCKKWAPDRKTVLHGSS